MATDQGSAGLLSSTSSFTRPVWPPGNLERVPYLPPEPEDICFSIQEGTWLGLTHYRCLSMMPDFANFSLEEIRLLQTFPSKKSSSDGEETFGIGGLSLNAKSRQETSGKSHHNADAATSSPLACFISPLAERDSSVVDAEKEWVDALSSAREAKLQFDKARAEYEKALATEKQKFKAYSDARAAADGS